MKALLLALKECLSFHLWGVSAGLGSVYKPGLVRMYSLILSFQRSYTYGCLLQGREEMLLSHAEAYILERDQLLRTIESTFSR